MTETSQDKISQDKTGQGRGPKGVMPLPGVAAIAFYLFLLAGMNVVSVVHGDARPAYLVFSVAFLAAGAGLLKMFRWAWTLSLAAVVLLTGMFFWKFSMQHSAPWIVQGLLNLVFFLYLIRPEVRSRLQ